MRLIQLYFHTIQQILKQHWKRNPSQNYALSHAGIVKCVVIYIYVFYSDFETKVLPLLNKKDLNTVDINYEETLTATPPLSFINNLREDGQCNVLLGLINKTDDATEQ
jgi:hypothetical protein